MKTEHIIPFWSFFHGNKISFHIFGSYVRRFFFLFSVVTMEEAKLMNFQTIYYFIFINILCVSIQFDIVS